MTASRTRRTQPAQQPSKVAPPEPQYRLTITANAAIMAQISEAFELQGRIHLGQIDEVYKELEYGIYDAATDQNLPIGSVAEEPAAREAGSARFEALMDFRDAFKPLLRQAEEVWRAHTHRVPLKALHTHGNRRERVAYGLWKHMEHRLLHIRLGGKPADSWTRMTVHYERPSGIAGDVTLTLEPLGPGEIGVKQDANSRV